MLPPGPEGDAMLMDVLMIATGSSGALTLLWLVRLVARMLGTPAGTTAHFAPSSDPVDVLVREVGGAKSQVHLMAGPTNCRPVAQALVDARLRHVQVEVLLDGEAEKDPDSDLHFLVQQGLVPLVAPAPPALRGLVAVIDGKTVACGSIEKTGEAAAGQLLLVRGNADLVAACQKQFATLRGPARAVGGMAATNPPRGDETKPVPPDVTTPAPEVSPAVPASRAADDVLAAVARGLATQTSDESAREEEEYSTTSGTTVTRATAELFARLRREAAASEEDDSTEKAA
jgi:hypothetical protein